MVRNGEDPNDATGDLLKQFEMPKEEFEKAFLRAQDSFDSVAEPSNATLKLATPKRRKKTIWRRARPPTPAKPRHSCRLDQDTANKYADTCRSEGAVLQRAAELDAAGIYLERACTIRARNGLFCTPDNARAHVEFAQNLSRRGDITTAEYHLRTALDIYRLLGMRNEVVYADVLLYQAVVVDKQARDFEAVSFYRAAIAVYEENRVYDGNFRVAVDLLVKKLRVQGREDEANHVVTEHTTLLRNESQVEVPIDIPADPGQLQSTWFVKPLIFF